MSLWGGSVNWVDLNISGRARRRPVSGACPLPPDGRVRARVTAARGVSSALPPAHALPTPAWFLPPLPARWLGSSAAICLGVKLLIHSSRPAAGLTLCQHYRRWPRNNPALCVKREECVDLHLTCQSKRPPLSQTRSWRPHSPDTAAHSTNFSVFYTFFSFDKFYKQILFFLISTRFFDKYIWTIPQTTILTSARNIGIFNIYIKFILNEHMSVCSHNYVLLCHYANIEMKSVWRVSDQSVVTRASRTRATWWLWQTKRLSMVVNDQGRMPRHGQNAMAPTSSRGKCRRVVSTTRQITHVEQTGQIKLTLLLLGRNTIIVIEAETTQEHTEAYIYIYITRMNALLILVINCHQWLRFLWFFAT